MAMHISRRNALITLGGAALAVAGCSSGGPLSTSSTTPPATLQPPPVRPTTVATYTFADEFDGPAGSAPDSYKWSFETGAGNQVGGNGEIETYVNSPLNAYQDGQSHLVLAATSPVPGTYDSTRLTTQGKFSQMYGHWEASVAIEDKRGCWPAFWLLGVNGPWPQCGEVDLMENYGTGTTTGTIWNAYASAKTQRVSAAADGNFHVYRMDWAPDQITLFRDNRAFAAASPQSLAPWPFNGNGGMYALLDIAVGGQGTGYTTPARASLPARMLIDYVHCWQ